jgi:hypothetical protein
MLRAHPLGGAVKVEFDDFRRARSDEEELTNVRPT